MSFGDALKKGAIWGFWVGGFLGIVADLVWVFGESATGTRPPFGVHPRSGL